MIELHDALATKFTQEEVIEIIQGEDQEKKFKLGFQFIFTTNIAELGWKILNSLEFVSLIDEKFIQDLLVTGEKKFSLFQLVKFILLIHKQKSKELNMAIQKHLASQPQQKSAEQTSANLPDLLQIIDYIEINMSDLSDVDLQTALLMLIKGMAQAQFSRDSTQISMVRYDVQRISEFFKNLHLSNDNRLAVLETVYYYIISFPDPQPLVSIGFLIVPEEMITQAIEKFFQFIKWRSGKIRESILLAMKRLILWMRQRLINYDVPVDIWISRTLALLHSNGYADIIDEIAGENILPAFISLVIPIFQDKILNIVQTLLTYSRNTKELFDKLVPRVPMLLKKLEDTKSKIFEPLMDLMCETLSAINQSDLLYKDLILFLKSHNRSPSKYVSKRIIGPSFASFCLSNNARVGLENLGNTCYLNSILQALFMTKQFCREVLLVTERFEDRAVVELQQLFALMLFSPRPEQNPKKVVNLIRPDDFLPGIQHDSSEFLGSLLDRLHELEKRRLTCDQRSSKMIEDEDWDVEEPTSTMTTLTVNNDEGSNSASSSNCSVADNQSSDSGIQSMELDSDRKEESCIDSDEKEVEMKELRVSNDKIIDNTTNLYHTYIQRIFGGKISTRYLCSSCNGNSINIDSFRDLQLSFPERNDDENASDVQYNVQQLLEFYFTSEELTLLGDNQYHCDNCKILCNGMRCTEIIEPPRNLILTLKHFRYDSRHHTRSKLLYKVFHDEILTVSVKGNFSSANSSRNVEYKLYAAVIHSGVSLDSGHYFTIAREGDNEWFKFNDSFVTKSSLEELRSLISPNTPYILFYQRLSNASSTIVHSYESASTSTLSSPSTSSATHPVIYENSFPDYQELSILLRNLIDDDKNKYEHEIMKSQLAVQHHSIMPSSRHDLDPDNNPDRGSSGSSGFNNGMDNFSRFIY